MKNPLAKLFALLSVCALGFGAVACDGIPTEIDTLDTQDPEVRLTPGVGSDS